MKVVKIASFVAVAVLTTAAFVECAPPKNKYDNVDIDRILSNERVMSSYIKCVLEQGPCNPEGRELKKTLPETLQTGCANCTEKQRLTAEKIIGHLTEKRKDDWKKLTTKYDPEGVFHKRFHKSH